MILKLEKKNHQQRSPIFKNNRDINKIVVSHKVSFGKKCFTNFFDYKDAKKFRPFFVFLPKVIESRRYIYETKIMYF